MLVEALLIIVVVAAIVAIGAVLNRHMERVAAIPEHEIAHSISSESLWRKAVRFIATRQRLITAAVLTKIIRRLKIVSLKTDNLSSRLLQKLEEERRALKEHRWE